AFFTLIFGAAPGDFFAATLPAAFAFFATRSPPTGRAAPARAADGHEILAEWPRALTAWHRGLDSGSKSITSGGEGFFDRDPTTFL
ncbi:MAG: hypothetical protein AAB297_05325, partial [Acidobacteriota bacterium]